MPTVDNFSVWIEVEGKQLPEYGVQSSTNGDQLIQTCWVPSEAGKEFKVLYRNALREFDTSTRLFVDGVPCTGFHMPRTTLVETIIHQGENTSAMTYKPYVFSNCQLTEDESTMGPAAASLGEILVDVNQVVFGAIKPRVFSIPDMPPLSIHERAKKGVVHGTQLGNEVAMSSKGSQVMATTTPIRKVASFLFKYRPLDVLKADGIIPQDKPTPVKRQADPEDIIDLTVEDDCQRCQCGASRRKKARVTKSVVKTEVKKEKSIMFGDGEVLDLTI